MLFTESLLAKKYEKTGRVWGPTSGRIWPDGGGDGGSQGVAGNALEK